MLNEVDKKAIEEKVNGMKLSEINKRLEEIKNTLKSNSDEAIDHIIPLLTESELLKTKADSMLGDIEKFLSQD